MRKTALITGASRGIGREAAALFARNGYDLYLACHTTEDSLRQLAKMLTERYGTSCMVFTGDIGNSSFVDSMFSRITRLDLLINNAAVSYIGLIQDMTDLDWKRVMDTNLNAAFYTCRRAVPLMLSAGHGRILNISSVWGNVGASLEVAYSASKGGINAFTKALAKELAPNNIQVNAAAFGIISTQMNEHLSTEELKQLQNEIPADRIASPPEAAALLLQLAEAPAYLTGQVITMDGGWT